MASETKQNISKSSAARVEQFVHDFIRSREVEMLTSDRAGLTATGEMR